MQLPWEMGILIMVNHNNNISHCFLGMIFFKLSYLGSWQNDSRIKLI
jgi:hypothetical protein